MTSSVDGMAAVLLCKVLSREGDGAVLRCLNH